MNIMGELALIFGICLVGEGVAALLPVAFPASVISMVLLMVLLLTGVVKDRHIQTASHFLVANMAFFFLPSFVGLLEHCGAAGAYRAAEKPAGPPAPYHCAHHAGGLSDHRVDGAAADAPPSEPEGGPPCLTRF